MCLRHYHHVILAKIRNYFYQDRENKEHGYIDKHITNFGKLSHKWWKVLMKIQQHMVLICSKPWIVKEMDRNLNGVSVKTYLQFAMSRVSMAKNPVTRYNFFCTLQRISTLCRCKIGKYMFHRSNIRHQFTSLQSRIALHVPR